MSRSFFFERIRINVEICCESVSDFVGSFGGALRKPLMVLAGIALIMTLRSARRGVQTMKNGGLTSGDSWFGSPRSPYGASGSNSNYQNPYSAGSGSYGSGSSSSTSRTITGGSSLFGRGTAERENSELSSTTGLGSISPYGGSAASNRFSSSGGMSSGPYASGSSLPAAGPILCHGPCRQTADLVTQFDGQVRVMDAGAFKDFGGVLGFYGQIETLTASEGAGVVEKVLQSPGAGKVLVIDGGGNMHSAIVTKAAVDFAKIAGWQGVIVHGVIQNAVDIQTVGIGVKALGTYPSKGKATSGSKGSVLNIAGMQFATNMWVYCDKDGIVLSDTELTPSGSASSTSSSLSSFSSSSSTAMGLQSSSSGATTSTMGNSLGYGTGATAGLGMQNQYAPQGMTGLQGGNGMTANMGPTTGGNGFQGSGHTMFSSSTPGSTNNNYARNLPGPSGNQRPGSYGQGGNAAYPYSHGAGNPYAYSSADQMIASLSIGIAMVISIVLA